MIAIVFQIAAAVIALTAAIMAWRLEKRLIRLRSGQDGMQKAAAELTEAVTRAEASVRNLRAEGAETAGELEALIARARATTDELRLMQNGAPRRAPAAPAAPAPARPAAPVETETPRPPLPASLRPEGASLIEALRRVR